MIEGNPQPLAIAARVLKAETIAQLRRLGDYSLHGWHILDRWALNTPNELRSLEAEGEVVLLGRLLQQQRIEQAAINRQPVGMDVMEVLAIAQVHTELDGLDAEFYRKAQRRNVLMHAVNEAQPADLEESAQRIKEVLRKAPGDGPRQRLRIVPRD